MMPQFDFSAAKSRNAMYIWRRVVCWMVLLSASRTLIAGPPEEDTPSDVASVRLENRGAYVLKTGRVGNHEYTVVLTPLWRGNSSDLAPLKRLRGLSTLIIYRAGVDDVALGYLAQLTSLERLTLNETTITDAGVARLNGLGNLRQLSLAHSRVRSASLVWLQNNKMLEDLDISNTDVDDSIVETLKRCSRLRRLRVANTRISSDAIMSLKAFLPDLVVQE